MPYDPQYSRTEGASASWSGSGESVSVVFSARSIISQRDADKRALDGARRLAQARLRSAYPNGTGIINVIPPATDTSTPPGPALFNVEFLRTDSAQACCLAGTGPCETATVSTQSIIAQRDVDRKALNWAKGLANSRLRCVVGPAEPADMGLRVTPASVSGVPDPFVSEGSEGGPFTPAQKTYVLTNTGTEDLLWTASGQAAWVTVSSASGFLCAGGSTNVVVGLAAGALTPAGYSSSVTFTAVGAQTGYTGQVTLTVTQAPLVSVSYSSAAGAATLCGISEYTSPSTPPKKYRRQTPSGGEYWCTRSGAGCTGNYNNQSKNVYGGAYVYSPTNCSVVNTQTKKFYGDGSGGSCTGAAPTLYSTDAMGLAWEPGFISIGPALTVTPTSKTWNFTGLCALSASWGGSAVSTLSEEDTEANAMARATITTGTSAQAYNEPRGAGDFTFLFRNVTASLSASDLLTGKSYRITLDTLTENYGGGGSVSGQHTIDFVAAGSTYNTTYNLTAPYGKQVTLSNPTITQTS